MISSNNKNEKKKKKKRLSSPMAEAEIFTVESKNAGDSLVGNTFCGMILGLRIQETPPQAKNTAEFSDARSRRWWPCILFQASEPHFRSPFTVISEGFAHPGAFAPSTTCERKAQINSSRCRFGRSSLSLSFPCAPPAHFQFAVYRVCWLGGS